MFVYGRFDSINKKNGGDLKVKGEKLFIYDDSPIFGTGSLPVRSRSKYLLIQVLTGPSTYFVQNESKFQKFF